MLYLASIMASSKFHDIIKRAASGAVFVLFTVSCVWFSAYSLFAAYGIFMTGALFEYYKLNGLKRSPLYVLGIFTGVGSYISVGFALLGYFDFKYLLFVILPILFAVVTTTFSSEKRPFSDFGKMMAGLAYAAFPFVAILFVGMKEGSEYHEQQGRFFLLLFMVLVWSTDTFAYLCGRFFGRNLMVPKISPGKTWEGTGGGVICSLLIAIGASQIFTERSLEDILVVWFAASVLGVIGDLSESKLKRSVNVKDSGIFMPGHGGFLDRFDSILLSAPFLMVYFILIKA